MKKIYPIPKTAKPRTMPNHLKSLQHLTWATIFACTCVAQTAVAATVYISDELTVPLRSGASGAHRILHRGLPSGTQMEVIGEDKSAGFTQIRTSRGTEGWIRSQYLVSEPIAKARLAEALRSAQNARNALNKEQQKVSKLTSDTKTQGNANVASQKRIRQLESELTEIKTLSAGAIQTHTENQKLTEVNARLQDELDDIAGIRAELEDNNRNQALLIGAGLLLLGLLAGVMIKARPHRSAWN